MNRKCGLVVILSLILTAGTFTMFSENSVGSGFRMDSDLKDSHASFLGEASSDNSGKSVAGAGDVNGDGLDDILIGAYLDDDGGNNAGQTYLVLGKLSDWSMDTDLSSADASFWGEDAGDLSGSSVSGAGDVNGDGYDDILIGAKGDDDGGANAGQTYLILGKASGWSMDTDLSNADASFWGEDADDQSGVSVSGAGDVNRDGYDDILIGAYDDDDGGNTAGQTYLILGKASGWAMDTDLSDADASFWGEDSGDWSGYSVSGAGDVNGDGYDDILIGAKGDDDGGSSAGQTYLILGKTSGWTMDQDLSTADASFWGENAPDSSGNSVSGAGDVNGDGYDDILIGAHLNGDGGVGSGQTYIILGRASGWYMDTDLSNADASFLGEDSGDWSGRSVSGAGDVNSDGFDDILIGANGDDDGGSLAGQTYLILGQPSGWGMDTDLSNADASFRGENSDDHSGESIASAGDVNGDGYDDILIGAYGNDDGGSSAGQTYLIFYESKPPSPRSIDICTNRKGDQIHLSWEQSPYWKNITGFIISRSLDGYNYNEVGRTSGTERKFIDIDVSLSFFYSYKIESVDMRGVKSNPSDPVFILCDMDNDIDGIGDIYDPDDDGDGILDVYDLIPFVQDTILWSRQDCDLSRSYSSFLGEGASDYSGYSIAGAGDVNGDGYDDILIGAYGNDDGGSLAGKTYLLLGKETGWGTDVDLSNADASFKGEDVGDFSGWSVAGAGDVNGDGYHDFLIGTPADDDGGTSAGQTYLILGKASGWGLDTDLSNADASFWGEDSNDFSGWSTAGAGDVNGDGYDDILIGAHNDEQGGINAGQTYLILGKASGWNMDTDLSDADASFWGEDLGDYSGWCVAGTGDVNGDGFDDILIGAYRDEGGGSSSGKTYLINRTVLDPIQNLSVDVTPSGNGFNVTWDDDIDDPFFYGIYRGTDPRALSRLGDATDPFFVDAEVKVGITYYYGVVAVCPLGGESALLISDGNMIIPVDEELREELRSMNDSLSDSLNEIWNIVDYTNRTIFPSLNMIRSSISQMDSSLTIRLNGIDKRLSYLEGDIVDLKKTLTGDLDDISQLVQQGLMNLDFINSTVLNLQSKVWEALNLIMDDLDGINTTMKDNIDDLEYEFHMDLYTLMLMLESVNSSIHEEMDEIDGMLDDLRSELLDDLIGLSSKMDEMEVDIIQQIEELIDDLDDTSLNEIMMTLQDISTQMGQDDEEILMMISNLEKKLTEFDSNTSLRIQNISSLMATMEALDGISSEMEGVSRDLKVLQTVEELVGDIEDEHKDTSNEVSSNNAYLKVIVIILVLLAIIQISFFLYRIISMRKGDTVEGPERW